MRACPLWLKVLLFPIRGHPRQSAVKPLFCRSPIIKSPDFLCVPSCPSWLKFLLFRFSIKRDHARFRRSRRRRAARATALCLRPSAIDPTPHSVLLKTKVKVPFERPIKRPIEAIFLRFSGLQSRSISALFFCFYCPVGRGLQSFTKY